MEKVFAFGKPVNGELFTDRETETKKLLANFTHGINTFVLSPRRWGKTSLVKKVAGLAASSQLKIVYMDILHCKTKEDFLQVFGTAILSQTSGKIEEVLNTAKKVLSRVSLDVSFSPDVTQPFTFKFRMSDDDTNTEEILSLPETIGTKKNIDIVVCIDEFQQISRFDQTDRFQAELRGIWQHQQRVSYCLFGSRKSAMEGLFDDTSKPFYKFGDIMYLKTIPLSYWTPYIQGKFEAVKKSISSDFCEKVCETVEYNSSYVQQLSWYILQNTETEVTEQIFNDSVNELVDQCSDVFETKTQDLPVYQMRLLRAISDGNKEGLFGKQIIREYKLGSSANVTIARKALLEKNLVEIDNGSLTLSDPVMNLWLHRLFG